MDSTLMLAQFLGLFLVLVSGAMLVQQKVTTELLSDLVKHQATLFVMAIVGLVGGLILVFMHNVWGGSLLSTVVTLVAWITLLKSVLILFLPTEVTHRFLKKFTSKQLYTISLVVSLVIGFYLVYGGFATLG